MSDSGNSGVEEACLMLAEVGLLSVGSTSGGVSGARYRFSLGVLTPGIDGMFEDYCLWVVRHESLIAEGRESGAADNAMLNSMDRSRTERHNRLAAAVGECLGLFDWSLDKLRSYVAAVSAQYIAPFPPSTAMLTPTERDVLDLAEGLEAFQRGR